jgi:RNA polymerase sigma-70 factor (ECF subfamily)
LVEDLVVQARAGDHAAFERLAGASVDRLYAVAWRVLRDAAAAEDAVQECLFRAWRDIRTLRDPSRWDAWTYRLLLHACRDEQRRARRRPMTIEVGSLDPVHGATGTRPGRTDGVAAVDQRDELERGFRRLSVDHRMVLALHFLLGYRPTEIADLLGITEGTASSRIHYAGRALRAALEADMRPARGTTGSAE